MISRIRLCRELWGLALCESSIWSWLEGPPPPRPDEDYIFEAAGEMFRSLRVQRVAAMRRYLNAKRPHAKRRPARQDSTADG